MANLSKKNAAADKKAEVTITKLTRDSLPRVPFAHIATSVLPKGYKLSIVFAGDKLTRTLNQTYRKKSYIPNVLSFPLGTHAGEIFVNLSEAKRQFKARRVSGTWTSFVALLVIHSMLHLKGMAHGRRMETREEIVLAQYGYRATLIS